MEKYIFNNNNNDDNDDDDNEEKENNKEREIKPMKDNWCKWKTIAHH